MYYQPTLLLLSFRSCFFVNKFLSVAANCDIHSFNIIYIISSLSRFLNKNNTTKRRINKKHNTSRIFIFYQHYYYFYYHFSTYTSSAGITLVLILSWEQSDVEKKIIVASSYRHSVIILYYQIKNIFSNPLLEGLTVIEISKRFYIQ